MTLDAGKAAKSAWYALAVYTLMYVANNIDRSVMAIVVEPVRKEFALNDSQMGVLTGLAFALTYSIAGLPIGYLIDRVNRRNLLAGLVTVWSAFTVVCGIVSSYWGLVVARLAVGASEAGGAPAALSLISDLFPGKTRSMALSIFWSSTAIGTAVSFVIGSYVAVEYGWRAAFLIAGAPGLAIAGLLFFTTREPQRGAMDDGGGETASAPTIGETARHILARPALVHALIGVGFSAVMLSGILVWAVSFFVRTHGLELTRAGLIVGLSVAGFGAVGSLLGGYLGDVAYKRWGLARLPLMAAGTTLGAASAAGAMAISSSFLAALLAFMVFEVLSRAYTAPGYNFLLSNMPAGMRGVCMSLVQSITNLVGYGLGPVIVGIVSDLTGELRYGIVAVSVIGAWVSAHFYWAHRHAIRGGAVAAG